MVWDGMGWAGLGWDGMGWDGMRWDGMGCHLAWKDSVCYMDFVVMICLTRLLSFQKIKRTSRSLLRQVSKVAIPFDTDVDFQKISSSRAGPAKNRSWGAFWDSLLAPFWCHFGASWHPFGSFWRPLGVLGLHFWLSWASCCSLGRLLGPF